MIHLSFGVWSYPGAHAIARELLHLCIELVGQEDGQWHAFLRFISGVAKHQTLERQSGHI